MSFRDNSNGVAEVLHIGTYERCVLSASPPPIVLADRNIWDQGVLAVGTAACKVGEWKLGLYYSSCLYINDSKVGRRAKKYTCRIVGV